MAVRPVEPGGEGTEQRWSLSERLATAPTWVVPLSTVVVTKLAGAVLITLVAVWAAGELSTLIAQVALSFFFALALEPAVQWIVERRPMRRGTATGLVFMAMVAIVGVLVVLLAPLAAGLATHIGELVPSWIDRANTWFAAHLGSRLVSSEQAAATASQVSDGVASWFDDVLGSVFGFASSGVALVFNFFTVAMFTFYLTAGAPQVRRAIASRLRPDHQRNLLFAWEVAVRETGGYFYSRMLLMLVNGLLFFFALVLVGVPVGAAAALALIESFIAVFIPAVGTYLGSAVPIVFVLATEGIAQALVILGYAVVYQQVENYLISPRLSARTMSVNSAVAFGSALAGGALFGPIGAFVALPVAGFTTSLVRAWGRSYEVVGDPDPIDAHDRGHDARAR